MREEICRRTIGNSARRLAGPILLALLICLAWTPGPMAAEAPAPSAEELLDRFVEHMGGVAAHEKIRNRVVQGTFQLPAQGLSASLKIHASRPNKSYVVIESEAMGTIEKGTDGTVAWQKSIMTGPVVMTGQMRDDFIRDARFDGLVGWRDTYANVEYIGTEAVEGRDCHAVVLSPEGSTDRTLYLDAESYLPVKISTVMDHPAGQIPVESYLADFRDVDGVRVAHELRVVTLGQEQLIIVESVEHNVDLPEDLFDVPDDVRELVAAE
jgi:hypothetical protein